MSGGARLRRRGFRVGQDGFSGKTQIGCSHSRFIPQSQYFRAASRLISSVISMTYCAIFRGSSHPPQHCLFCRSRARLPVHAPEFFISALVTLLVVVDPARSGADFHLADRTACRAPARRQVALRASLIAFADPVRRGADRRLAAASARHRAARLPDRRRTAAVLDRLRNGVRGAHRARDQCGRSRGRGACPQHRRLPAGDPADGRARRDHGGDPAGRPRPGRSGSACRPARGDRARCWLA